jgi:hypothetical protein
LPGIKGAKAASVIRALIDYHPPIGIRCLAELSGVDASYSSRLARSLERKALLARDTAGRIEDYDWIEMLREWSEVYSVMKSNSAQTYIAPRGIDSVLATLASIETDYAITGSFAAANVAPAAPARLLMVYTKNAMVLADSLGITATDAGANVALIEPSGDFAFARSIARNDLTYAALSQVAADLLSGPGRGPTEAEALIEWMSANEETWRLSSEEARA